MVLNSRKIQVMLWQIQQIYGGSKMLKFIGKVVVGTLVVGGMVLIYSLFVGGLVMNTLLG